MRHRQRTRLTLTTLAALILTGVTGCQSAMPSRKTMASNEPPLSGSSGSGFVAEKPPRASSTAFVDRHPLFYKPKEYYESSGNNTAVKVAGATLIGIPVGLYGELRQIVTGSPSKAY